MPENFTATESCISDNILFASWNEIKHMTDKLRLRNMRTFK